MFENVYLIDDDTNTLFLHRHFLSSYHFFNTLLEFQDATIAIDSLIHDHSKNQNLVLLDLNMPIMSGWEFVNKISEVLSTDQLKRTTIAVVSSSTNPRDLKRAEAHPNIYSFIEKPFLPEDIDNFLIALKADKSKQAAAHI